MPMVDIFRRFPFLFFVQFAFSGATIIFGERKISMNAHIRKSDGIPQGLGAHCRTASLLAERALAPVGLAAAGALAGLLHDMGKATDAFQEYLLASYEHPERRGDSTPHAPVGAIFAYEAWFKGDLLTRLTAQLVSMAVYGHHASLPDCLNEKGESPYLAYFTPEGKKELHFDEASDNFLREVAARAELDALFARAKTEIGAFCARLDRDGQALQLGLAARMLLSAVVDADRWDSACFERGADPLAPGEPAPDWAALCQTFDAYAEKTFKEKSELNDIRARISRDCLACADLGPGIFSLTVPTGGGKTFATLRYALARAAAAGARRIFYIIPFNTILDQNAADIREALGHYEGILEHHSGIVRDEEAESAEAEYRLLTERWDSPIVLTSMVQFLNSLYRKENTDARRMRALAHSILIFDEVQALPKRCTRLFESAIRFLVRFCGLTVVLCTATQPRLRLAAREMIGDVENLFSNMRRVHYLDQTRPEVTNAEAAEKLVALMKAHKSVLAVVNTKDAARQIYQLVKEALAGEAACYHLSTNMCPAHRLAILDEVKARTHKDARKPTFLVSTALIEAGINVSFPAVVRSLAGLGSVIQAAGRCNRNAEEKMGTVYLWRLAEENLSKLPEIHDGQALSDAYLQDYADSVDRIADPDVIAKYFEDERKKSEKELPFPYPKWGTNLCDMLGNNEKCAKEAESRRNGVLKRLAIGHSFRTAGEVFGVINQNTRAILVPYGAEGKKLIADILGAHDLREEIRLIRRAQLFSVNVYEHSFRALEKRGALYRLGDTGIVALREEFYGAESGLQVEPGAMDLLYTE